jgi:hypothetical protein
MKRFVFMALIVAVVFAASMASADLVQLKFVDVAPGSINVGVDGRGTIVAGLYNLQFYPPVSVAVPTSVSGCCVDPAWASSSFQEYSLSRVAANSSYAAAMYLMDKYVTTTPALAQVAIWETVWDWSNPVNLSGNNFKLLSGLDITQQNTVIDYVNEAKVAYANGLITTALLNKYVLAESPVNNGYGISPQDYIFRSETTSVPPVPIPPTVYLLGAGLVGLVGLRRKFRK